MTDEELEELNKKILLAKIILLERVNEIRKMLTEKVLINKEERLDLVNKVCDLYVGTKGLMKIFDKIFDEELI